MIEIERTYLAKYLPEGLLQAEHKTIIDIYLPQTVPHPTLRLRQNGASYELTKKKPISGTDSSIQQEQTIDLNQHEFEAISHIPGKRVAKQRYYYRHQGTVYEFDIFQGELSGLVLIDVEFETETAMQQFPLPDFCLVDVTQEAFIAGGVLAGKSYTDINSQLNSYNYKALDALVSN